MAKPTIAQLEEQLKAAKKEKKLQQDRERKAYEEARDALINNLAGFAVDANGQMCDLKYESMKQMTAFRERMLEYGSLKGGEKNKGSFEIKNDNYKISFSSNIIKGFDETAELAAEKINLFLTSFVKKRDKQTFEIVSALLQRNEKNGDFDIGLINRLYKLEDKYDDENWKEGIRLFKQAYNPSGTAHYIRFYKKNENGAWDNVVLDFAKIR